MIHSALLHAFLFDRFLCAPYINYQLEVLVSEGKMFSFLLVALGRRMDASLCDEMLAFLEI
jgi:hypothetical protein